MCVSDGSECLGRLGHQLAAGLCPPLGGRVGTTVEERPEWDPSSLLSHVGARWG